VLLPLGKRDIGLYNTAYSEPELAFFGIVEIEAPCYDRSSKMLPLGSPCQTPGLHLNAARLDVRRPFPLKTES
jgi:hypothetical protein